MLSRRPGGLFRRFRVAAGEHYPPAAAMFRAHSKPSPRFPPVMTTVFIGTLQARFRLPLQL